MVLIFVWCHWVYIFVVYLTSSYMSLTFFDDVHEFEAVLIHLDLDLLDLPSISGSGSAESVSASFSLKAESVSPSFSLKNILGGRLRNIVCALLYARLCVYLFLYVCMCCMAFMSVYFVTLVSLVKIFPPSRSHHIGMLYYFLLLDMAKHIIINVNDV